MRYGTKRPGRMRDPGEHERSPRGVSVFTRSSSGTIANRLRDREAREDAEPVRMRADGRREEKPEWSRLAVAIRTHFDAEYAKRRGN